MRDDEALLWIQVVALTVGYVVAWFAALVLAYDPTFHMATSPRSAPRRPREPHDSSTASA